MRIYSVRISFFLSGCKFCTDCLPSFFCYAFWIRLTDYVSFFLEFCIEIVSETGYTHLTFVDGAV